MGYQKKQQTMLGAVLAVLVLLAPYFAGADAYAAVKSEKSWGSGVTDKALSVYDGKGYYWKLPGQNMWACTGYAEWAMNRVFGASPRVPNYGYVCDVRRFFIKNGNAIVAYGSHVSASLGGNGRYYSYGTVKPGDIVFFFKRPTGCGGKITKKALGKTRGELHSNNSRTGPGAWTHVAVAGGRIAGKNGIQAKLHHNNTRLGIHYGGTIKEVLNSYSNVKGATDYQVVRLFDESTGKGRIRKTYQRKDWYDLKPDLSGAKFLINGQTLVTNRSGYTPASKKLKPGTYRLKETAAPAGFRLMRPNPRNVKIVKDRTQTFTVSDEPKDSKAPLSIEKKMKINGNTVPEQKAKFRIWPVKYGKYKAGAAWWKKIPAAVKASVTTDGSGKAKTKDLPVKSPVFSGKYYIHQTAGDARVRWLSNKTVTFRKPMTYQAVDPSNETLTIVKKDAESGAVVPQKGITFRIKRKGAWDRLVARLAAEEMSGKEKDRIIAAFLSDDPERALSEAGCSIEGAGWASLGSTSAFVTDESGIAKVPSISPGDTGEYEIYETVSPEGYKLPGYAVAAKDPDAASDLDKPQAFRLAGVTSTAAVTYSNYPLPEIMTTASDAVTGGHAGSAAGSAVIIDKVSYSGLEAGKTYTLSAVLMDAKSGAAFRDANGKQAAARTVFTPSSPDGTAEVAIRFSGKAAEGKDLVVFERLYEGGYDEQPEGTPLAVHEDLTDEGQTVSYPGGSTSAADKDTGARMGTLKENAVIVDTFRYENLIPGKEYTVKGVLYEKSTGQPLLVNGKPVTGSTVFAAAERNGSVKVTFTFDSRALAGKSVVVAETLTAGGKEVLVHFDLNDAAQTVSYPEIKTSAFDLQTGERTGAYGRIVTAVDRVRYRNLIPGERYRISGYFADRESGTPLNAGSKHASVDEERAGGNSVVASAVDFVPASKDGFVDVPFTFDSRLLAGKTAVVFEELYKAGVPVASHCDVNAGAQTIRFPGISTTARDTASGTPHTAPSESASVTDTVRYTGLTTGKRYTLRGVLMDRDTEKPLLIGGRMVTAEKTFRAKAASGKTELVFRFDARRLKGKTLVAFEELKRKGVTVAVHRDIKDAQQTVYVEEDAPKTGDGGLLASSCVTLLAGFLAMAMLKNRRRF